MWLLFALLAVSLFALVNVLDSVLIRYFEKSPVALQWIQVFPSLVIFALLSCFVPLQSPWIPLMLIVGVVSFFGDLFLLKALDLVDVSLTNLAWAIQAVLIAAAGFLLFHETWSTFQLVGAILVIGAILFVTVAQAQLSLRALGILCLIAVFNAPYYIGIKYASLHGAEFFVVLFWPLFAREVFSFVAPWFVPSLRAEIRSMYANFGGRFLLLACSGTIVFLTAFFLITLAYTTGPSSLVAMTANAQPFITIVLAGLLSRFFPSYCAKELLTKPSILLKTAGFILVFLGLALLASHQ